MAMAEIRRLGEEHFEARLALMQFAFQNQLSPDKVEEKRNYFRPDIHYGLFEGDRLLSQLTILPFEAWVRGRKMAMGGIAGVASWPDVRRQGGISRLMRHALEVMREQGRSFSMLAPFSFAFYRKYGYEMTIVRKNYTLDTRHLPPGRPVPGKVRIVAKERETLEPIYAAHAGRFDGMMARDGKWWERRVLSKSGIVAVYFDERGEGQGYLLYEVSERKLQVHDWAFVTADAETALWRYISDHDSMIEQLRITVPEDDALPFLLPNPRFKQEVEPYFMSRIVDAEAFVAQYPFEAHDGPLEIQLSLEDSYAPWNQGRFLLRLQHDGSARLERLAEAGALANEAGDAETAGEAETDRITCDIATLTAMLLGGRRPSWLHRIGRLCGPDALITALERRVPLQRPYLADFF